MFRGSFLDAPFSSPLSAPFPALALSPTTSLRCSVLLRFHPLPICKGGLCFGRQAEQSPHRSKLPPGEAMAFTQESLSLPKIITSCSRSRSDLGCVNDEKTLRVSRELKATENARRREGQRKPTLTELASTEAVTKATCEAGVPGAVLDKVCLALFLSFSPSQSHPLRRLLAGIFREAVTIRSPDGWRGEDSRAQVCFCVCVISFVFVFKVRRHPKKYPQVFPIDRAQQLQFSTLEKSPSSIECVGCDIVQADHAPDGGVAQGVIHGVLVRHHGRNQEEVEEGLGQEVKGQEEEDAQETTKCTCMDGMR